MLGHKAEIAAGSWDEYTKGSWVVVVRETAGTNAAEETKTNPRSAP